MDDAEKQLWEAYARSRSIEDRNRCVELHLNIAEAIAAGMSKKVPMPHGDLLSAAYEGLIDAVEKFDLARGCKFQTYATWRVRNHVRDYLRQMDDHSRLYRTREPMVREWEAQLGRKATRDEVYEYFGFVLNDRKTESLSSEINSRGDTRSSAIADSRSVGDVSDVSYLLAGFNRQERLAVMLYWIGGYRMREVGEQLGVCESRVSQMMSDLLPRMRENFERAA